MSSERVLMAKVIGEYIVSLRRIEAGEVSVTVYSLSKVLLVLDEDSTVFWRKVRKNLELME